jgi:RNA polymerase primary sigma factor
VWWIRQSILQAISEQSRIVRMPLNQVGFQSKLSKARVDFEQKYQRRPSVQELAELMEVPEDKIAEAMGANGKKVSVDAPFQNDESSAMIDVMTDEDAPTTDNSMECFCRIQCQHTIRCTTTFFHTFNPGTICIQYTTDSTIAYK